MMIGAQGGHWGSFGVNWGLVLRLGVIILKFGFRIELGLG